MESFEITVKPFDALTPYELYDILKARIDVFVVEQQCPYPEADGIDQIADHFCLRSDNGLLAYLRVFPDEEGNVWIGRVLTLVRGKHYGRILMHKAVEYAEARYPGKPIYLKSQRYATGFYAKEGFKVCSEEFMEDGIPHVNMVRLRKHERNL